MRHEEPIDLFGITAELQTIICAKAIRFMDNGYPDLTSLQYLEHIPENIEVWPYSKRNQAHDPQRTILTFYEEDQLLYRNLNRIDVVISHLSLYYAATGFDISPCIDARVQSQKAALLTNALVNAAFMTNGIRVIPSLRTGGIETLDVLKCYPRNICYAYGALGCNQRYQTLAGCITALKLMLCEPSQVLVYGKPSREDQSIFAERGIPISVFADYQMNCRLRATERNTTNV